MVNPCARPVIPSIVPGFKFHRKQPTAVFLGIYDPRPPGFQDYLCLQSGTINKRNHILIIDLRFLLPEQSRCQNGIMYQLCIAIPSARSPAIPGCLGSQPGFPYYDPEGSREFRSWYLKEFGMAPPSKRLSPTPEQKRPFFARITDPVSPYYVAADRPVFGGKIIVLANENTGSAASLLTGLIQDNPAAVIVVLSQQSHRSVLSLPCIFSILCCCDRRTWSCSSSASSAAGCSVRPAITSARTGLFRWRHTLYPGQLILDVPCWGTNRSASKHTSGMRESYTI